MKNNKKAFTLVELIVSTTIVVVLASIWFYTYSKHNLTSRDAKRKMDLVTIKTGLNLYKREKGSYPLPGNMFTLTSGWLELAYQGKMNKNVSLTTLKSLPLDPKIKVPYTYSIIQNKKEFQLATTLENNGRPISFLVWNYVPVSMNTFPSIILALDTTESVDITDPDIQERFIVNETNYNLPYSTDSWQAYSSETPLSAILEELQSNEKYWQNLDYRSCQEIYDAGKALWNGEYQIYTETGWLQTVNCVFDWSLTSTGVCINLPSYADWTASQFYTKTFNGISYVPLEKYAQYSTSTVDGNCYFDCDINYTWVDPNCVADTQSASCGGSIPWNASATTSSDFTQTWNGSSWDPASMNWWESQSECDFDCDTNYSWDGDSCEPIPGTWVSIGLSWQPPFWWRPKCSSIEWQACTPIWSTSECEQSCLLFICTIKDLECQP